MTSNQFKIKEHKVLNDVVNMLTLHGSIQLFAEQFSVSYSLNKVVENTDLAPVPVAAMNGNNINGTLVILRDSLTELSEEAVAKEVATQLGLELA